MEKLGFAAKKVTHFFFFYFCLEGIINEKNCRHSIFQTFQKQCQKLALPGPFIYPKEQSQEKSAHLGHVLTIGMQ